MNEPDRILSDDEIKEILLAAGDTLDYALSQSKSLTVIDDPADEVRESLERARKSIEAAVSKQQSLISMRGYAANALSRLRVALMAVQEMDRVDERVRLTGRAAARAISLIYPLTQSEGPLFLVGRKRRSRRRRGLAAGSAGRHHLVFSVAVGLDSWFYTGLAGDIASGGLFLATYNIQSVGSKITVFAEMAQSRVIMGTAKVAWVREHGVSNRDLPAGMGVVFQNLTKAAKTEIDTYLSENDSIFYEAV